MKKVLALGLVLVCASMASAGNANITSYMCGPDGDEAMCERSCPADVGLGTPELLLNLYVTQSDLPAHMQGSFKASSEEDPSVTLVEEVWNDTDFAWTGYEFYMWMDKTFQISDVVAPLNWDSVINQPVAGVNPNNPSQSGYLGSVIYSVGALGSPILYDTDTFVDAAELGEFGMKVTFVGSINFCTEQIPVPEPMTMAMLAMGGVALIRRRG